MKHDICNIQFKLTEIDNYEILDPEHVIPRFYVCHCSKVLLYARTEFSTLPNILMIALSLIHTD